MKFWDNLGDPSCFPTPLPDCLSSADIRHYVLRLDSRSRREKTTNVTVFWPRFFKRDDPNFLRHVVSAIHLHRLAKFG